MAWNSCAKSGVRYHTVLPSCLRGSIEHGLGGRRWTQWFVSRRGLTCALCAVAFHFDVTWFQINDVSNFVYQFVLVNNKENIKAPHFCPLVADEISSRPLMLETLPCQDVSLSYFLHINTLRPRQDGRHFADDIFMCILFNEKCCILIKFSLKYVHNGPIHHNPTFVQIMAWRRSGDKPLS